MTAGHVDPLLFAGLIGSGLARGRYDDLYYRDGTWKTEADLMRVPWVAAEIRQEHRERAAWRAQHLAPDRLTYPQT